MLDQIVFIMQGFGLVMAVLAALWLISAVLGRVIGSAAPEPAAPAPVPEATDDTVPPAHMAAIAATVAAVTGDRARVVRVRIPAHGVAAWVGSAHTEQAVGRRIATRWRASPPAHSSSATGTEEDRR